MPLYEYECLSCGTRIELIQRAGDSPPEACAQCGGPVRKLLSAPAVHFKGSGWYVTDYARKGGAAGDSKAAEGKEAGAKEGAATEGAAREGDAATSAAPKDGAAKSTAETSCKTGSAGGGAKSAAADPS